METYENWTTLRERVHAMPIDRQTAFALGCAYGTLGSNRAGLQAALKSGWTALVHGGDVAQTLRDLENDYDLDDDPVAATYYALSSLGGEAGAAWSAASRAMDQAFDQVDYPGDAGAFRQLERDAQTQIVQSEITRQTQLLGAVESAPDLSAVINRLRPE